jgi:hypothetical protein
MDAARNVLETATASGVVRREAMTFYMASETPSVTRKPDDEEGLTHRHVRRLPTIYRSETDMRFSPLIRSDRADVFVRAAVAEREPLGDPPLPID